MTVLYKVYSRLLTCKVAEIRKFACPSVGLVHPQSQYLAFPLPLRNIPHQSRSTDLPCRSNRRLVPPLEVLTPLSPVVLVSYLVKQ